ncbi:hypothetical protein CROQUDRAFT_44473 [Cronartium quercuum f. sp. fusiforme G11]|uniref:Uncharacterized protein n=1 Tax=Cronartium quercuum f. sp. fusiforme G11 TaxID=708437 RepID=A0A9P6TC67_9BASI|nr:hypothetical protein CROQUDRAFT_44473 [Cronartium quercuum f. sp. fusiforme G11]
MSPRTALSQQPIEASTSGSSSLPTSHTTPAPTTSPAEEPPKPIEPESSTDQVSVPFDDVPLDELKGTEKRETREKLSRLNFLLKASGIYSQIIAQNIERERLAREVNQKKQAEKLSEPAPPTTTTDISSSRTTRRASTRAVKKDVPTTSTSKARLRKKQDAQTAAAVEAESEAIEVTKMIEQARTTGEEVDETGIESSTSSVNVGQPALLTGAKMRPYQLAGMHWLATLYENGLNGILSDEMGLGKTLQTIAFLCYLRERGVWGPFLIVCPLSTVANWVNEFERFCPTVPVVLYHGSKDERTSLRASRMAPPEDDPKAWLGKPVGKRPVKRARSANGKSGLTAWTGTNTKETFPVVVTSYEIVMNDRQFLSQYAWSYIVVDESHRLKNLECKLVQELKSYTSANRLLLTGTPLHNNLKELWSLLNFILPEIFDDYSSFEQWFDLSSVTAATDSAAALSSAQAQHIVSNLHAILKPFMLRRMKSEVETSLPKKKEYLLSAPLTAQQKELYDAVINKSLRALLVNQKSKAAEESSDDDDTPLALMKKPSQRLSLARNTKATRKLHGYAEISDKQFFDDVELGICSEIDQSLNESVKTSEERLMSKPEAQNRAAVKSVNQMKLQNVVMQLRKVCNHPWLFDWPIDPQTGEYSVGAGLISSSGKMLLLDKLLKGLFERGHKVLIFSQFTSMLDIIQDWATDLNGWRVCRIDGSTSQDERRAQMKDFNQSEGPDACSLFLLSTRAGGVGINLVAADTVILFDSDWNPQQDLQAQDRVHRIGQTKPVLVFRLVSGNTIESKILQKASQKRKLETLVIGTGFDLTKKDDDDDNNDNHKGNESDDLQEIVLGKRSNRSKQKSMKELAEALLKADGEKIVLAEEGDEILGDEQLAALLDRSVSEVFFFFFLSIFVVYIHIYWGGSL